MYEPYNPYYNYNYNNPYYNLQTQAQQLPKQTPQMYKPQNGFVLQGKVVDSLDVVKATDIPYDGSVSYFPLTDHSAIITKQLQQDGTSKMVIYKPILDNEEETKVRYITEDDLREQIKDMDNKYITESDLKEQIKNVNSKDMKDIKEDIKILKRKLEDIVDDIRDKKEK
jgi:hypothetical protein